MQKIFIDWEEIKPGLRNPVVLLAQGLGSGCIRPFPGLWGTGAALLIYVVVVHFFALDQNTWAAWTLAAAAFGIPLATYAERIIGQKDPHSVVWDEWCGVWLAFLYLPFSFTILIIGFFLFRFLDIRKPWIIGMADSRLKGGLGIMLDDIIAGVAVNIFLQVLLFVLRGFGVNPI